MEGAELRLIYFAPIDPRHQSQAEVDTKNTVCAIGTHLTGVRLRGEAKKELLLFTKTQVKVAGKEAFRRIELQYAGCLEGMTMELDKQRTLTHEKEMRLEDKDKQLADKDAELARMVEHLSRGWRIIESHVASSS